MRSLRGRPLLARPTLRPQRAAVHVALLAYTALALGPILLIMVNAFKPHRAIFGAPLTLPGPGRFSLAGFDKVLTQSDFGLYVANSLVVTVVALALVLLLGAMAAWALASLTLAVAPAARCSPASAWPSVPGRRA